MLRMFSTINGQVEQIDRNPHPLPVEEIEW